MQKRSNYFELHPKVKNIWAILTSEPERESERAIFEGGVVRSKNDGVPLHQIPIGGRTGNAYAERQKTNNQRMIPRLPTAGQPSDTTLRMIPNAVIGQRARQTDTAIVPTHPLEDQLAIS